MSVEAEGDEPAAGELVLHRSSDEHRIAGVALHEILDGIVMPTFGRDARCDTGGAKLGFDQVFQGRRGRGHEGLFAQLARGDAPAAGQGAPGRRKDDELFAAQHLGGEPRGDGTSM